MRRPDNTHSAMPGVKVAFREYHPEQEGPKPGVGVIVSAMLVFDHPDIPDVLMGTIGKHGMTQKTWDLFESAMVSRAEDIVRSCA